MSRFPPEILDLIVGNLDGDRSTLKSCSVVSKSWVSRARTLLFAHVELHSLVPPNLNQWIRAFPDPANSPAHYTRKLFIHGSGITSDTRAKGYAWMQAFCHVIELEVDENPSNGRAISLARLQGLSPTLKSLTLAHSTASASNVFNLICSFPLLEDLSLHFRIVGRTTSRLDVLSTSPKLTGSLFLGNRIRFAAPALLRLPGGIHFSNIEIRCPIDDAVSVADLVLECSDTLKSLSIYYTFPHRYTMPPTIDLSKATKLTRVEFGCGTPHVEWIISTLQTVKHPSLQQITLCSLLLSSPPATETCYREWQDLDHILARLWTSCSVRTRMTREEGKEHFGVVSDIFPELAQRGGVDVVL